MIATYYRLTKPGIIYGNLVNMGAGFLFACCLPIVGSTGRYGFNGALLLATTAGVALIIAAACVINNCIDRNIDTKMARTKRRALVTGEVSVRSALLYATVLGVVGFTVLALWTNALTVLLGAIAIFTYVGPYSITKRRTVYGTVVGSIAGALPPVAGYCAVTGRFDVAAWLLLLIYTCWQMPHFYAIATYRYKDYAAAGLPVLPVKKGVHVAKRQASLYIVAFILANILLTTTGYTGYSYLVVMTFAGAYWLAQCLQGFRATNDRRWGGRLFGVSLYVVLILDALLATGALLP